MTLNHRKGRLREWNVSWSGLMIVFQVMFASNDKAAAVSEG